MNWRLAFLGLAWLTTACAVAPLTPTPRAVSESSEAAPPQGVISAPTKLSQPTLASSVTPTYIVVWTDATDPTAAPTPLPLVTPTTVARAGDAPQNPAPTAIPTIIPAPVVVPPPSAEVAAAEQYCIDLTNAQRALAGLAPLARDETLMAIARSRVADMVARGYTGHHDPVTGASLGRPQILGAGYRWAGENWYGTINPPPAIVEVAMGWFMTDPPHYRNILNTNYTGVGVGIAFNGQQWLLVQNFGG